MNVPAVSISASVVQLPVQTLSDHTAARVKMDMLGMERQDAYRLVSGVCKNSHVLENKKKPCQGNLLGRHSLR